MDLRETEIMENGQYVPISYSLTMPMFSSLNLPGELTMMAGRKSFIHPSSRAEMSLNKSKECSQLLIHQRQPGNHAGVSRLWYNNAGQQFKCQSITFDQRALLSVRNVIPLVEKTGFLGVGK